MDLKSKENLCLLKRYQAFEIQSTRALGGWLPGIERWEVKHEIGRHIWEDAQHSKELRTRLWEVGDIESAEAVLFDITDETMHVRLGKSGCRRCSSLVATMERWTISWMSAGSWSSNTRSIRCNARRPRVSDLAAYAVD